MTEDPAPLDIPCAIANLHFGNGHIGTTVPVQEAYTLPPTFASDLTEHEIEIN